MLVPVFIHMADTNQKFQRLILFYFILYFISGYFQRIWADSFPNLAKRISSTDQWEIFLRFHRHNLRDAQHNMFIPRPNTEALKKSFRYKGAVTWNSLSAEAKQATTLNSFYCAIV